MRAYKVLIKFVDKNTLKEQEIGDIVKYKDDRAHEILSYGKYLEEVVEAIEVGEVVEKPKRARKKVEESE